MERCTHWLHVSFASCVLQWFLFCFCALCVCVCACVILDFCNWFVGVGRSIVNAFNEFGDMLVSAWQQVTDWVSMQVQIGWQAICNLGKQLVNGFMQFACDVANVVCAAA